MSAPEHSVNRFVARWAAADGSELADCRLFVHELCGRLGLAAPTPLTVRGTIRTRCVGRRDAGVPAAGRLGSGRAGPPNRIERKCCLRRGG